MRETAETLLSLIDNNQQTAVIDRLAPELSSVRPSEAHVALLTEMERSVIELQFALNQLPEQTRIALYRILGVTLQGAIAATTILMFTKSSGFTGQSVTIPAGTQASTVDRSVSVTTDYEMTIGSLFSTQRGAATCTVSGDIGRIPIGTFVLLIDSIAGVQSVTNTTDLAGGRNAETPAQAEIRAREEMQFGQRLLTAEDWKTFIYFEVLRRKGRVTAFELYLTNFMFGGFGYLLLIIQDDQGLAPTNDMLLAVSNIIAVRHAAGLQISPRAADYRVFSIRAEIKIRQGASAEVLTTRAEQNLRAFFAPLTFDYGPESLDRFISLSDIVGQIEQAGPDRISVVTSGNRFAVSLLFGDTELQEDVPLLIGELPELDQVSFVLR